MAIEMPEAPTTETTETTKPSVLLRRAIAHGVQQVQGTAYHRRLNAFCALGALALESNPQLARIIVRNIDNATDHAGVMELEQIGMRALEGSGLVLVTDPRSRLRQGTLGRMIVDLNDGAGWSFAQIADWLETMGM